MYVKPDRDGCCFWVGVIILALGAVAVLAVGGFAQGVPGHNTSDPSCKYYCPPGQKCPTTPAWTQPGTFKSGISKTFVRPESSPARRPMVPVIRTKSVVPVLYDANNPAAAGVYVGVIEGRGVTITCWHVAKHGVRRAGGSLVTGIHKDKFGYDLAALLTIPLDVPPIILGPAAQIGAVVTISGYPHGRYGQRQSRVIAVSEPDPGQEWHGLILAGSSAVGDSGGAVLDTNNHLVGLLWGTVTDSSQNSTATAVPPIADFLRRLQIMLSEGDKVQTQDEPEYRIEWQDGEGNALPPPIQEPPATVDLSGILSELAALRETIESLELKQGEKGEPGERGETGEAGVSPTIDYKLIAAEVVKVLPPITLQTIKADPAVRYSQEEIERIRNLKPGDVIHETTGHLGGAPLRLRLVPRSKGK